MIKVKKTILLFFNDQSTAEFSDISKILYSQSQQYLVINGNAFCNSAWDTAFFRNEWLKMCNEISIKLGKPVVVNAAVTPDCLDRLENTALFSKIYYSATVSDNETLIQRYNELNIQNSDWRKSAILKNEFLRENAKSEYPDMQVFDMTGMTVREVADSIDRWILKCVKKEKQKSGKI